tara:strand:+ start:270 stop:1145 length:876 start_codon:yes stop_codon:yes gene_type:complete
MKTILYTTDYSENSVAALQYAQRMSEDMEVHLVIAHIFDYPTVLGLEGLYEPFPYIEETIYDSNLSKLEGFCTDNIGFKWKSAKVHLQVIENPSLIKGILTLIEQWHPQLLVMGMKGESAMKELLMGSTTKHLMDKAPCPVMAIPADAVYEPFKTIVYASDFEEEDIYALRKLAEMAERCDADINIIHISTKKEIFGVEHINWFKDLVSEKVPYDRIEYELIFSENVFDSLKTYLDKVAPNLIVLLEREQKGFLKKLLHGDLVKKMETYGKVPVLSFRGSHHQLFYFKEAL